MSPQRLVKTTLLSMLGASLLFTASCSNRDVQATDTAGSDHQITLTDQRGEEITIDGPVDSAAFAVMPAPAIFAAVDGSYDHITAVNQSTLGVNQNGMFSTIFPGSAESAVAAGPDFIPNVETLLDIDPDVVIQWGNQGDELTRPIEDAGFPVVGLQYGTHEDLQTWITLFGEILEKPERAEMILDWQDRTQAEMAERVKAADTAAPRAMMLSVADGTFSTSNGEDYDGFQYPMVGADFVSEGFLTEDGQLNAEQIIEWDPEVILLSGFDTSTPAEIYDDPRLSAVSAVKDKRVYKNPIGAYRWQVPGAEIPLYWQWLNEVLYPNQEIPAGEDLRSNVREAFDMLFDYEINEAEIDEILRFDLNGGSADYGQFRG